MFTFFLNLFLVAIALSFVIILITSRSLSNLSLFTALSINIISLFLMDLNIQSIGWNVFTYGLTFIILNNIFLCLLFISFGILSNNSKIKDLIGKIIAFYIKVFFAYPNLIFRKLNSITGEILDLVNNRINNQLYNLLVIEPLKLINKEYDKISEHHLLTYENNKLLDHKFLFSALFTALMSEKEFKTQGKKIMITSIIKDDKVFYIHKNIIIDENTTLEIYLEKIKHNIQMFYESGYPLSAFNILQVKLWNYNPKIIRKGRKSEKGNTIHQFKRSFHSNVIINRNNNLNLIKPLKTPQNVNKISIAAIDLETIELNSTQLPISISFSYFIKGEVHTIFELIDYNLLLKNSNEAVKLLWLKFFTKLVALNLQKCIVYSHNLGSFDGYFLFKGLLELPNIDINNVNSIIDDLHRFISIDVVWKDNKFVFRDSMRIFPISLQELCNIFKVEGKLSNYNPAFNNINLFQNKDLLNQFIEYSQQDSISLLKALIKAQDIYINEHKVDIATIWSTSTLSLKIFRQNFLESNIPTLTNKLDNIIRLAYIGGSTDYYYQYGENLKHYDVNSLYPKAMCNPMPIEFLGEIDGTTVKLENVFGFAEARITTPDNMVIPLLPFKLNNETLHPLGSWIGIYFTEELKTIVKYGYKVELIKVYSFSKADIFSNYIKFFYNIKKNSVGSLRFIAKMHLNQLYGYFGRRKTLIQTKNVYRNELSHYYGHYSVFAEIKINEMISTILMSTNLDYDLINEIKDNTNLEIISDFRSVKSHVGIAAAVTSYARIEMMELKMLLIKLGIKLYYTDTDSVFTDKELPNYLIGSDLGQLKDELNGGVIQKAYFLGIKKYGYIYDNGKIHSVFSGVPRDGLTWNEVESISMGNTIIKNIPVKFYKNFSNLDITIKNSMSVSIEFNTRKRLLNNNYLPMKINVKFLIKIDYFLKIIKNKIVNLIRKLNLRKLY